MLRTSFTMALLVLACGAGVGAVDAPPVDSGIVANARGVAGGALNRLPESGALLLWGTCLAAASLALSRTRSDTDK
ncbi:MAG TPA: hypothetical protein VMW48_02335 [Vicinamibacterales bacterium]|nr:hypothetical protein [Vicinamibacterales bacterium]